MNLLKIFSKNRRSDHLENHIQSVVDPIVPLDLQAYNQHNKGGRPKALTDAQVIQIMRWKSENDWLQGQCLLAGRVQRREKCGKICRKGSFVYQRAVWRNLRRKELLLSLPMAKARGFLCCHSVIDLSMGGLITPTTGTYPRYVQRLFAPAHDCDLVCFLRQRFPWHNPPNIQVVGSTRHDFTCCGLVPSDTY